MSKCGDCGELRGLHHSKYCRRKPESSQVEIIGFQNRWGESNCFLNSAIQILYFLISWHLENFRNKVSDFSLCPQKSTHYCLCCGLKEIFSQYSISANKPKNEAIDISKLRAELASSFSSTGEFEINYPGDSLEALLALLRALHQQSATSKSDSSNSPCFPECPSHNIFSLLVEETIICSCSAQSNFKWDYSTFYHHFYVNEIFEDSENCEKFALLAIKENDLVRSIEASTVMKCESRLQEFLKRQWEATRLEMCPNECKNPNSQRILQLLQSPKVFMVSLIWKDFKPHLLKILQVLASIPYCISMDNIYNNTAASVHVLKSAIFYGGGHYICAIRLGSQKSWYKIDDELGKKAGNGTWSDLVLDSLKNRFYPVGLFYEEKTESENNNMSAQDWVKIERILLQFLEKNQENDENSTEWQCECGSINDGTWNVCHACDHIKPGVKGWVCSQCTFINDTIHSICRSCGTWKSKEKIGKMWECLCGKRNEIRVRVCQKCKKCHLCRETTGARCQKCYSVFECNVCKKFIPKKDGKICFRCKKKCDGTCPDCGLRVTNGNFVCEDCTNTLKKCGGCEKFNFADMEKCANCAESFSSQKCGDCKQSIKNCVCRIDEKCGFCHKSFLKTDEKFCSKCLDQLSCPQCVKKLKPEISICKSCARNLVTCKKCGSIYAKSQKCSNLLCNSIEVKSPKEKANEIPLKLSKLTNCKLCTQELSAAYGFCMDCKLKINSAKCKFCSSNICWDLCEVCIRSSEECSKCNHRYHISEETCLNCS